MKICRNCGTQFADNIEICPTCGNIMLNTAQYNAMQSNPYNPPVQQVQMQTPFQNQTASYTGQEKSVFQITDNSPLGAAPQNQPMGAYPQMNPAPNPYGYPNMQGGAAVKKKNTGIIIGAVAGGVVLLIIVALVIGAFLSKPLEDKVGTVDEVNSVYTNRYADFTLRAPENWTMSNFDDAFDNYDSESIKTDSNGRKYIKNQNGVSFYYEAFLSYFDHGATASVFVIGLDDVKGRDITEIAKDFVEGANNKYFLQQIDSGTESIAGKKYAYFSYSGSLLLLNMYGKLYVRVLDSKTALVFVIFSTDESDISSVVSNIS